MFVRTNRRAIAMMFVRMSLCPSVWDGGMQCDYTVHFSADLSLWLDSPLFWAPWHQSISNYPSRFFQLYLAERWAMDKCKLGVISQERLKIG